MTYLSRAGVIQYSTGVIDEAVVNEPMVCFSGGSAWMEAKYQLEVKGDGCHIL